MRSGAVWRLPGLLLALAAIAPGARAAPLPSAADVASRLQARFAKMQDYECLMHSESRAGGKVEAATLHIWYRQPGLLRLRVLKGRQRGSELLLGADGVLRGRRGGLLRPFSRRLNRSDPSLRSLRGLPVWEVDFGSFLHTMQNRISMPGGSTEVSEGPGSTLLVEIRYTEAQSGTGSTAKASPDGRETSPAAPPAKLRDVWTVDAKGWLLQGGDVYAGDERVDHFDFTDVRVDTGLKESWFRL